MTEPETKWKTIAVLLLFAACSITSADDTKGNPNLYLQTHIRNTKRSRRRGGKRPPPADHCR